jgi:hypothetical protein
MHLKRTHNAINKITDVKTDASISDEVADAFILPNIQSTTHTSTSTLNTNEEIEYINDDKMEMRHVTQTLTTDSEDSIVHIEPTCDAQTAGSILLRDLTKMISLLQSEIVVPRKTVQFFIKNLSVFLTTSLTLALQKWHDDGMRENGACINNILSIINDSVVNFSSEFARHKYYEKIGTFIRPQEYPIALENVEFCRGLRKQVIGTGQFISLRQVLQKFLSIPGVFTTIDEYVKNCMRSSSVINIVNTSTWLQTSTTENANEKIFPLLLYYDEFETGNLLSSHAGIHKLGAVYTSIACLPPHLASQIKYIFLFALFHYSDRLTEAGNRAAFQSVINEINYLSSTGIVLDIPQFQGVIKFKLGAIIGDNLGLHSILGFVESFNANYSCRICKANKELLQQMCFEDISLLRTNENYTIDIATKNVNETGVKYQAVFYSLDNFNFFEQVAVDIMHDILEGVAKYTMTFIINSLLTKNIFSIRELNDRAKAFDYGPDLNNKPPLLSVQNTCNIRWKMSSIEALNYVKYFSCYIAHKVPDNDEHWSLYILLRRILDYAMTDSVDITICDQLRWTVKEFNDLYLKLSSTSLKPKFHYLIHYARIMEKLGPLRNLWSMRFESKHRVLKTAARSSANRINLCKTLAIKHQLQLNHLFLENKLPPNFQHSRKIKKINVEDFTLLVTQFDLPLSIKLYTASFVKVNGITYRPKDVLALHFDEYGDPVFFEISNIFFSSQKKVFFKGYLFETITFDPHIYAYLVEKTDCQHFVSYKSLMFLHPNTLSILPPFECFYVTIRNSFD